MTKSEVMIYIVINEYKERRQENDKWKHCITARKKKRLENRTDSFHTIFDSLCQLDLQLFLCICSQRYSIEVYTDWIAYCAVIFSIPYDTSIWFVSRELLARYIRSGIWKKNSRIDTFDIDRTDIKGGKVIQRLICINPL